MLQNKLIAQLADSARSASHHFVGTSIIAATPAGWCCIATAIRSDPQCLLSRFSTALCVCLSLVPNCRPERLRLYQHWADTLAIEWGSDINDLVTELEQQQQKLKELYDRAALQVGLRRGVYTQGSTLCLGPDWLVNNLG